MEPSVYQIGPADEQRLREFLHRHGVQMLPEGDVKTSSEGQEQYWLVTAEKAKLFSFSTVFEPTGRQLLCIGPRRKLAHKVYDLLIEELERSTTRVKSLR